MAYDGSGKITVLLVDDDEIDVMGVKRAFRQSNLENNIVVAGNGIEALEKLRDPESVPPPYLVLLDLNMPRMNGIEFLEAMRADPSIRASVIFVLTTSKADEDRRRAYAHNVAGYIVKDGREDSLINVADLLNRYAHTVSLP